MGYLGEPRRLRKFYTSQDEPEAPQEPFTFSAQTYNFSSSAITPLYTIPAGKTLYIKAITLSVALRGATGAGVDSSGGYYTFISPDLSLTGSSYGGIICYARAGYASNQSVTIPYEVPIRVTSGTVLYVVGLAYGSSQSMNVAVSIIGFEERERVY